MKIYLRNIKITTMTNGSSLNIGKTLNVVQKSQGDGNGTQQNQESLPVPVTPPGPIPLPSPPTRNIRT